jgi:hypothetical protein
MRKSTKQSLKKKPKHISLKSLRKKSWGLISLYVRKFAADKNGIVLCYTCGKPHFWTDMDCGHYIHGDCLDFELNNLRPQCNYCNRRLHGNSGIFAEKLIKEIGQEQVFLLREKSRQVKKFTILELEEIIKTYKNWQELIDNLKRERK